MSPRFLDVDVDLALDTLTRDPVAVGYEILDAFGAFAAARHPGIIASGNVHLDWPVPPEVPRYETSPLARSVCGPPRSARAARR